MKKSRLIKLLAKYDQNKGFWGCGFRFGGDPDPVYQLKEKLKPNGELYTHSPEHDFMFRPGQGALRNISLFNEYIDSSQLSARIFREWRDRYKNTTTLALPTDKDVFEIRLEHLLVLDDYAFDATELKAIWAQDANIDKTLNPLKNNEPFSDQAMEKLRAHPVLITCFEPLSPGAKR